MQIKKDQLLSAAAKTGITEHQALDLWQQLSTSNATIDHPLDLSHTLYYLGATIVIVAMTWLFGTGWEAFGGQGILAISLVYIAIFTALGTYLWNNAHKTPGGLFITLAICMVPLAIYGFQTYTGWWIVDEPGQYKNFYEWVRGGWFPMEVGTLLASFVALWCFPFPFLTAPLFFTLWFMSMDITPLIFGDTSSFDPFLHISVVFGLTILFSAYYIDQRTRQDFAFWGYFFGMLALWPALSMLLSDSEWQRFTFFLINLLFIFLSILLQRRIFLVFGTIGVFYYLASLFYLYFYDSPFFPFILSFSGIATIFLGLLYAKKREEIENSVLKSLPQSFIKHLPQSRHHTNE